MGVIDGKDQRKKANVDIKCEQGLIDKNMKGGDIPVELFLFGRPQNIFCSFLNAKSTEPILSGWLIYIGGSKGGRQGRAPPPWGSKFFHFHAVFGKNLKNNSNFGSWRTSLGKILDPPLIYVAFRRTILSIFCWLVCSQLSHSWGRDIFGQHGREPLADLVTDWLCNWLDKVELPISLQSRTHTLTENCNKTATNTETDT